MASKLITIIAGLGPGTGASIARKFAASYPLVVMSRKPESYSALVQEINDAGGKAVGISADVSDSKSMGNAVEQIKKEFGTSVGAAAAVFNASGGFSRKPFLELTEQEFCSALDISTRGAFLFSQAVLPLLLNGVEQESKYPPTLIFTGATASIKANALMSSFATGKFALRAMTSSLAKEFGPKGVHVSHAIIDGVIDLPRSKDFLKDAGPDAKISPAGIADAYWSLHTQPRSALTWEIDIRPWVEKW